MTLTSKQLGTITEYQCITYLLERGYNVSVPIGENCAYDFIVEKDGTLYKIQCKHSTAKSNGESFTFSCETTRINATSVKYHKYSKNQIDFFATYYDNICYIIPVEECGAAKTLRVKWPENNQVKNVNWAHNYEADKMLSK